jgi:hypothetical protein
MFSAELAELFQLNLIFLKLFVLGQAVVPLLTF